MEENQPRTVEVRGKTYELSPCENGTLFYVMETPYEMAEKEGLFEVNRIALGVAEPVGDNLNSAIAAIELAEIFERLVSYVIETGYYEDLDTIRWYLNDEWKEIRPRKVDL